jgi:hypothetical protein
VIAAHRSGVECGRRIFVLTDGVVSHLSELEVLSRSLVDCEEAGISVVGVGLGIAPIQLPQLFPVAVYSPRSADLGVALSVALEVSHVGTESKISPTLLVSQMDKSKIDNLFKNLTNPKATVNKKLAERVREKTVSKDMNEIFGNINILFDDIRSGSNTTDEPYKDGFFNGFRILIVCLYLGSPGTPDEKISRAVFNEGCGKSIRRKGFCLIYYFGVSNFS